MPSYNSDKERCSALSRSDGGFADITDFAVQASAYVEGNDRTCAIMHASDLERCIDQALSHYFDPVRIKKLYKQNGALGSCFNKCEMIYALGRINQETYRNLEIIRVVRNTFAHCQRPITFKTPEVEALCRHFVVPRTVNPNVQALADLLEVPVANEPEEIAVSTSKRLYVHVCRQLAANFLYLCHQPELSLP